MNAPDCTRNQAAQWPRISCIAGLLALTIGYRLLAADRPDLMNTAPLMAACFGGGLLLGWRFCWVPAFLLLASDLFLGWSHGTGVGGYTLANGAVYTLIALAGAWIGGKHRQWFTLLTGTLTASVGFYLLSNSYVWLVSPEYTKTWAGWWQSQTIGLPQYQPQAWVFLVRSLIGGAVWCLLAAPLFFWAPVRLERPAMA